MQTVPTQTSIFHPKFNIKALISIAIWLTVGYLTGQTIVERQVIEQDQGLHQRNVRFVIRDQFGFFYFFGEKAIQRFDGKDFTYVDHAALSRAGIEVNDIEQVKQLTLGQILLICNETNKHFVIDPHEARISYLNLPHHLNVTDGQLFITQAKNNRQQTAPYLLDEDGNLSQSGPSFATDFKPIQVNPQKDQVILVKPDSTVVVQENGKTRSLAVKGLSITNNSKTYIWTDSIIYRLFGDQLHRVVQLPSDKQKKLTLLKKDHAGNTIAAYSDRIRFNDYLYVLTKTEKLKTYDTLTTRTRGLFRDFYTDDASYKWMMVGYNAVSIVSLLRDGVNIIYYRDGFTKNAFANVISGLAADREHTYFLKESKGIFVVDSTRSKGYRPLIADVDYKESFHHNGKLYYGAADDLLYSYCYRYDGSSRLVQTDVNTKTWIDVRIPFKVNDLLPVGNQQVIVVGFKEKVGQAAIYDFNNRQLEYIAIPKLSIIRSIYYHDSTRTYWIGTTRGLSVLDEDFEEIAIFDSFQDKSTGRYINNNDIITARAFHGKMVVGSLGGAFLINPHDLRTVKTLSEPHQLTNGQVIGIMPDHEGFCWLTTFNGVNIMDSTFNIVQQVYDNQGLSHREFNSKSICRDHSGNVYGGTLNGVTMFTPKKVRGWKATQGFKTLDVEAFKGKTKVTLVRDQNSYQVYSTYDSVQITYCRPDYYRFPFGSDYIKTSTSDSTVAKVKAKDNIITLKDLRPGTTELLLTDPSSDLKETLSFEVKYNYTWLLQVLGAMGAFGLVILALYRYNRNKILERSLLDQRISQLQLTALQSQMNPHFIFNALGAIQYFIQTHDADKADEYLSNFAMLMRRILDSSKTKHVSLTQEIETLKLYVGLESIRFEGLFDYQFLLEDMVNLDFRVPPMVLQPYLENAINHGLYNLKERHGNLTVHIKSPDESTLVVTITDNGVGRKRAAELRTKRHKSRGMMIINDRINTINSLGGMHVNVEITDLYEDQAPAGTRVIVTIMDDLG